LLRSSMCTFQQNISTFHVVNRRNSICSRKALRAIQFMHFLVVWINFLMSRCFRRGDDVLNVLFAAIVIVASIVSSRK
jgi:hypothetical protein